jgi:anti-sigma B factor antagonist
MVTESLPEQSFRIGSFGGLPVVTSPADVNISNTERLRAALVTAAGDHATLILDMSATAFCDSTGISVLVMAMKRAQADGGELRLVIGGPAVRRIFKATGVDQVFRIFETLPEAAAAGPERAHLSAEPRPAE